MPAFSKPVIGGDLNAWGAKINDSLDNLKESSDANATAVAGVSGVASTASNNAAAAVATANAASTTASAAATSATAAAGSASAAAASAASLASRTGTQAVGQRELLVNAKDFGALGDGVANDKPAIQAALNAAIGMVLLPEGDYLISSGTLSVPEGVSLVGRGRGVTRLLRGASGGDLVDLSGGSVGSTLTTLTANAAVGDATLTVASTASIAAGQWLLLLDDRAPDPDKPTRPNGELVQVATVNSGTSLTLKTTSPTATQSSYRGVSGTFDDAAQEGIGSYLTSSNARLVAVTLAEGSSVRSLSLINPTPGVGNGVGISAGATLGANISDVEISGMDGTGINLGHAVGASVTNCHIHDLVDDPGNDRYGYGINITGAASDIVVSGCTFERMRHAVTTDGHTSGGIPRRITVADCRAYRTHATSFDTHGAGYDILFADCVSTESATYGFTSRARSVTFRGCHAVRPVGYGFNVGALPARRVVIDSCLVRDGGTSAVRIAGDGIVDVHISNLYVDGCNEHGVILGYGNTRQVVTDSRFFNIGQTLSPSYGITFAAGALGTVNAPNTYISGCEFVKNKTYGAATNYNAAVNIANAAISGAVVFGSRAHGIYTGGSGFILDSGTGTVLWDNARPESSNMSGSLPGATTTQLTNIASIVNLTKRRGAPVFNITTGKPVWGLADGAAAVWVDGTGATVHTPA